MSRLTSIFIYFLMFGAIAPLFAQTTGPSDKDAKIQMEMQGPQYELSMTIPEDVNGVDYNELYYVVNELHVRTASGLQIIHGETVPRLRNEAGRSSVPIKLTVINDVAWRRDSGTQEQFLAMTKLSEEQANEIGSTMETRLKALIGSNIDLTTEVRTEKLQAADTSIRDISQKLAALSTLESVQIDSKALVTERLKQLRQDLQRLEMERAAKLARQKALMSGMAVQMNRAKEQRTDDARLKYYQAGVEVQQAKLARMKKAPGAFADAEVAEAQAELLQAQAQVAVRQNELNRSDKGELLDRLSDELAMVSIDLSDVELQIDQLRKNLAMYDPSVLNAQSLDRLLTQEPYLQPRDRNAKSPLRTELNHKLSALYIERFCLKVKDLKVTPIEPAASDPSIPSTQQLKMPSAPGPRAPRAAPAPMPRPEAP